MILLGMKRPAESCWRKPEAAAGKQRCPACSEEAGSPRPIQHAGTQHHCWEIFTPAPCFSHCWPPPPLPGQDIPT